MPARLSCPAKLNLFLEIRERRPDGYHNLGTLFQALEVGDTLEAELAADLELICDPPVTSAPEDNLVLKAARLVREACGHGARDLPGIRFRLEKRLPAGAGLGGGSSDAAGALLLCRDLWGLSLEPDALLDLARRLGADVPFFLSGGTSFAEGIGDRLQPAPEPFPFHVVVATPDCHVDTAWAYRQLRPKPRYAWEKFKAVYHIHNEDPRFYRLLANDFEVPMRRHFPAIDGLIRALEEHAPAKAMLSGSGASVFALFEDEGAAARALEAVRAGCRFACLTRFAA